jgi:hypothetical protein
MSLSELSLEFKDYSVDEGSVMGYYSYDQDVVFVRSFGVYTNRPSPYGWSPYTENPSRWRKVYNVL